MPLNLTTPSFRFAFDVAHSQRALCSSGHAGIEPLGFTTVPMPMLPVGPISKEPHPTMLQLLPLQQRLQQPSQQQPLWHVQPQHRNLLLQSQQRPQMAAPVMPQITQSPYQLTHQPPERQKEQRITRVGLSYRCGRCGQPKKGHTCSSVTMPLTEAQLAVAKATQAAMAGEARAADVTATSPNTVATAPDTSVGFEAMQPVQLTSQNVTPIASGLETLAEQADTMASKQTSQTDATVATKVETTLLVPSSAPTPALVSRAPAPIMKTMAYEPLAYGPASNMQAVAATSLGGAAARAEAEASARRALAEAEILCVAPSLLQFADMCNRCERALSPVRESSPKVNRSHESSQLGAKSTPGSSVSQRLATSDERRAKRPKLRRGESPFRVRLTLRGHK
uniref:Uncharacterized protein n=1 Tax=Calcidiscus leptoporus TaxID=127549 RepID=A0A7S0JJI6_9EUKA